MDTPLTSIANNPHYQHLVRTRNRLGWMMTILMLVIYYGFIYLVAFEKEFMSRSVFGGVTSYAVLGGLSVILITIVSTGIYVFIANHKFDHLTEKIKRESHH